jgi:hypothetical protein
MHTYLNRITNGLLHQETSQRKGYHRHLLNYLYRKTILKRSQCYTILCYARAL